MTQLPHRAPRARNVNILHDAQMTLGDRIADRVAAWGGSWSFIITSLVVLLLWTLGNTFVLLTRAFDPYPFVFLNLILSMLAALQAPIIMMSQNRQSAKDRLSAELDYEVNVKAEQEIMGIHQRMDREIIGLHQKIDVLLRAGGHDPAACAPALDPARPSA